jgi:hypothetical protein
LAFLAVIGCAATPLRVASQVGPSISGGTIGSNKD